MSISSSKTLIEQKVQALPTKLTLLVVSTLTVMAGETIAPSLPAMQAHFAEVDNAAYWVRLALTMPAMIPVQLPFYLKSLLSANASQSGLAIAVATLFAAISSLQYRRVKARLNFITIYALAFLNMGVGYGLISLARGFPIVLLGLAIAGSGLGLLTPNMNFCLTSVTPDGMRGRILSGITTFFFLGQFLSPFFSQPLSQWLGLGPTYAVAGGIMLILAAFTGLVVMR